MTGSTRTSVDVTKITGPYPLLALFLVVVEGILLFWLARAEERVERIVAGVSMALLLAVFLFAFTRIRNGAEPSAIEPPGLAGPVAPAERDATIVEVQAPKSDELAGRDFVIARPPEDWTVSKTTEREAIANNLGISDEGAIQALLGDDPQEIDVISMSSPRSIAIGFTPGESLIDGRKVPTALGIELPVRLRVFPMDRAQPPFYVERPLEHNFHHFLAQVMRSGAVTLHELPQVSETGSGRRRITAVLSQRIENAHVNQRPAKTIDVYLALIAIEGDVRDHFLTLNYPSMPVGSDPGLTEDQATLQRLVDSFRSLKVIDATAERQARHAIADRKLDELKRAKGEDLFWFEFSILIGRVAGLDLSDATDRLAAIRQLRPFEALASELGVSDDELVDLWNAMHEAEAGDATQFKKTMDDLIQGVVADDEGKTDEDNRSGANQTQRPRCRVKPPVTGRKEPKRQAR